MDYGRWNEWGGLWTEGNKMKHGQWSVDWRKRDETWTMKSITVTNHKLFHINLENYRSSFWFIYSWTLYFISTRMLTNH